MYDRQVLSNLVVLIKCQNLIQENDIKFHPDFSFQCKEKHKLNNVFNNFLTPKILKIYVRISGRIHVIPYLDTFLIEVHSKHIDSIL